MYLFDQLVAMQIYFINKNEIRKIKSSHLTMSIATERIYHVPIPVVIKLLNEIKSLNISLPLDVTSKGNVMWQWMHIMSVISALIFSVNGPRKLIYVVLSVDYVLFSFWIKSCGSDSFVILDLKLQTRLFLSIWIKSCGPEFFVILHQKLGTRFFCHS